MFGKTIVENGVVQTLCRQCQMRCGINVHIKEGKMERITGFEQHPQNRGRICAKALSAIDLAYHPDRILTPLKRQENGDFREISYDQAMDEITEKLRHLRARHGARSVGVWTGEAILSSPQQEGYVRRFIHGFGSPNVLCAGSLCALSRSFAYWLFQGGYHVSSADFPNARLIFLWGANLRVSHPPEWWRLEEGLRNGAKLVVIDPRRSKTALKADLFLQLRPGTDGALAWGLCNQLLESGDFDHDLAEHSAGFESFKAYARRFTPEYVARQTGMEQKTLQELADLIRKNRPNIIHYPGVSLEHQTNGLNNLRAVACLNGLCGGLNIRGGELWAKPLPERSVWSHYELPHTDTQPVGAELFPLYDWFLAGHTMTAPDYMLGEGEYPLRGMMISACNPVITNPNASKVARALSNLDLLVCRDLFLTTTARLAHYVMPTSMFLERSELFTYECFQTAALSTKVLDTPGAQDEFDFWHDLSRRLDLGKEYFPWADEDEVHRWILEPSGISLEAMKAHPEGIQYAPIEYGNPLDQPLATPSGKLEFSSSYLEERGHAALPEYIPPDYLQTKDRNYPFILISGGRNEIFHHSRIIDLRKYRKLSPDPECEIHPDDAVRLGIKKDDRVRIKSPLGAIEVKARVVKKTDILPGLLQVTHGWDAALTRRWEKANVNHLTSDRDNDKISGFPNMKIVAVQAHKVS